MHAERDILLPTLSVRLPSPGTVSKQVDTSSFLMVGLEGAINILVF